ncbi:Transcription termination factor 2 [Frankliniella fusca]|uniref:Transcription termination factor 2 n=1 Tax=Frankliniella fusca TaxID=407009 RepID=A0AAE1LWD5_9NEOP|nr:Transcription termination factor 2 [Frankliniella fusca]
MQRIFKPWFKHYSNIINITQIFATVIASNRICIATRQIGISNVLSTYNIIVSTKLDVYDIVAMKIPTHRWLVSSVFLVLQ